MKKIYFLLLISGILCLGLNSCSNSTSNTNTRKDIDTTKTTESAVGEKLVSDKKPELSDGKVEKITTEQFKQKVYDYVKNKEWKFEGDLPCIIDFYADWCRPCKMVAPIMEELAQTYKGKIRIYKVNVDDEGELSSQFGISSIPTMYFCTTGAKPHIIVGAYPKEEYVRMIKEVLKIE